MDILLINPYYTQVEGNYSFYPPAPPLGLLYIATYLNKHGLSAEISEFGIFSITDAVTTGKRIRFGISDDQIRERLQRDKPRIVGITNMYSIYYRDVIEIANTIKSFDPEITVVVGGNHSSSYWAHVLKNEAIDYVVIGEGENTLLELCKSLLENGGADNIPGVALRNSDGVIRKNQDRPLMENIDDIPSPAWDLIDFKQYLNNQNPYSMRAPGTGIVSSRGCPGKCVYCTVQAVWGRKWRGHSPKRVVDEIEFLQKTYGIKEIAFLDDSASINAKRWIGICDELIRRKCNVRWTTPNGIAHWSLTPEILNKMKEAGCYRITFGIESGNPETREFLGKPHSLEQAKKLLHHANKIGMWTLCTNIIGFPYENEDSIQDTIRFAKECGTDFACFYMLIPQPTSNVYQYFKKEGLLNFDNFFESDTYDEEEFEKINYILNETGCDTVHLKKEELSSLQKKAYRSFMLHSVLKYTSNPLHILRKIRSIEDLRYIMRILFRVLGIYFRTLNPINRKSSDYLYAESKKSVEKTN